MSNEAALSFEARAVEQPGRWPSRLPLGHAGRRPKARAQAHPDGIVDLSVGTPVDPTPRSRRAGARGGGRQPRLSR